MMKKLQIALILMLIPATLFSQNDRQLLVKKTADFRITGDGSSASWNATAWTDLPQRSGTGDPMPTRFKLLYSGTGIYCLFDCTDRKLTASMDKDFLDLWKEDVAEIFFWPDERYPSYFEYEISPLNYQLPLIITNEKGDVKWVPFHYDEGVKIDHSAVVNGGEKKNGARISGWKAEFFIPYKFMGVLNNVSPVSGTKWRANMYRVDYDEPANRRSWTWQPVTKSFHETGKFGTLLFE